MMDLKTVHYFFKVPKTVKKSSEADMPRNKLYSHTQFSADVYKICPKKSEKTHISRITPVLVEIGVLYRYRGLLK
jgi:hypothetical protein